MDNSDIVMSRLALMNFGIFGKFFSALRYVFKKVFRALTVRNGILIIRDLLFDSLFCLGWR
uniref:Uncharacterized protein n=2 Tax=Meloidogyne enterolobii TaxID=390850 RepID=A0A6V7U6I1_MELEN|nr:unnamed protein product [Meloidogyne enterolobii]